MIRKDEALLILQKWQQEQTPLRVVARLFDGIFLFDCRILKFSESSVAVQLAGEFDQCEFVIQDFVFEFGDPRDPEEAKQGSANHTYSSALALVRPNEHIVFLEIAT